MLSLDLRSWRPILQMSMSSIIMLPSLGSTILKSACMRVDFPLPVLPTTPTFFLAGKVQLMLFRTSGRWSAYRIYKRLKLIREKIVCIIEPVLLIISNCLTCKSVNFGYMVLNIWLKYSRIFVC